MRDTLQGHVGGVTMQHRYLDLYLSRSRQASLNVFIDLEDMPDVISAVNSGFECILDSLGAMEDWLDTNPQTYSVVSDACFTHYASLIQKIIGEDGQHMMRWSNMYLSLPSDDDIAPRIRELFDHDAPQLKRLSVTGLEYNSKGQSRLYRSLSSLPALSELILSSAEFLSIIPPSPSLKKLQMDLDANDFNSAPFHLISTFPLLDVLSLQCDEEEQFDENFSFPAIHLPDLKVLELHGSPPDTFVQALRIKQLNKLVLMRQEDSIPIVDVYQVTKHLKWGGKWNTVYDSDVLSDVFSRLFPQLQQAHTITVPSTFAAKETVKKVVEDCRANGQLTSLKSVFTFVGGKRTLLI